MKILVYVIGILTSALWAYVLTLGAVAYSTANTGAAEVVPYVAAGAVMLTIVWLMVIWLARRARR